MKHLSLSVCIAVCLSACGFTQSHEKVAQVQAQQVGLVAVANSNFDASFVASSAKFSQYKKLTIEALDLTAVKIINPSNQTSFQEPWQLNDVDKKYYASKYSAAAIKNLIDSGLFSVATDSVENTLVLKAKIIQIAPLASKDDQKSRPNIMNVYSQGFGRMTIVFELYDMQTNKIIFSATDEDDLGGVWEKNDRVQNNNRIKLAFDNWLRGLKRELEKVSK